jgi:beta-fructofuranosidase
VVNIYEATNPDLTQWTYRGVLFQHPDPEARTVECPNFFQLGKEWVLLVSPYGKVQYFVGDFDEATCRFHARTRGLLDCGPNFYAPNTMQLQDGRRLVWGWVNGFPGGHGWNGCLSLPRQLSLSRNGELRQEPIPQLTHLRGMPLKWRKLKLTERPQVLTMPETNTLEILAELDLQTANSLRLELTNRDGATRSVKVGFNGSELAVMDTKAPLSLTGPARTLRLRIFLDRSVLEVFANDTVCLTKTFAPIAENPALALSAEGGDARAGLVEAWPVNTIW